MATQHHASPAVDSADNEPIRILRLPEVIKRTGHSRTVIYDKLKSNAFPRPVALGSRAIGFVEREVSAYISSLVEASRQPTNRRRNAFDAREV